MTKNKKKWTLLIYSNGNNEIEPEIYNNFSTLTHLKDINNINVVTEIGRAKSSLVSLINPSKLLYQNQSWNGVRRYALKGSENILVADRAIANMAHPLNLYDFIKWGMENFPAENYALLISGHGLSYIGGITDLTLGNFYTMGIPEMCKVMNLIGEDLKEHIDILILDMCNMNLTEIIYELGFCKNNGCKRVITYWENGPLFGIPLNNIVEFLDNNTQNTNIDNLCKDLMDYLKSPLISYKLNWKELNKIKENFNFMGEYFIQNNIYDTKKVNKLLKTGVPKPCSNYIEEINSLISSLCIYNSSFNKTISIKFISTDLGRAIALYKRLAFAENNAWTKLLSRYDIKSNQKVSDLNPLILSDAAIYSFLKNLNPYLSSQEILDIIKKLKSNSI
ncbi:clostripain-related cysteine peptidase [Clostridium tetani]|uniref:Alpha-clostripain-like protein n=1 Tax=Clostridium tetani (strain Massachusetts / E88) TaxID=212717 RepID=Q898K5_CLOTE|nr:clostripain-related cysteine peptidase [Clostridium tetani]AAO35074.1 alpha-clostripain-like protein [Clostridium tetani E88]KGI37461.1 hypothetical protein LA33_11415 [Clostridium tetani ATCC 9441]KGI40868.1 hypothetical protein KY52_03745 [Clostridium tetani]KGI44344.1 hypothetical protein KY54_07985 [Clostridium tetani]KGI44377.1 hypothetical protein KY55_03205 [Clostridium tetani]